MKHILLFLMIFLISSCSDKKDAKMDTVGSSLTENNEETDIVLSNITYTTEALEILERHRTRLKTILPQMLDAEVKIYKNTLTEIEKVPALTYTLDESIMLINKIRIEAGVTLIEKEIELNQIYFELFNELSILNLKYNKIKSCEFTDFYDVGPIVLSDEVMLKIDEMVKDEDIRIALEKAKNNRDMAFAVVMIIPAASSCKGILGGVTQAAKYFKAGKMLTGKSSYLAKGSYKLMNKQVAAYIAKTFKNDQIRSAVAKVGYVKPAVGTAHVATNKTLNYLSTEESKIVFKVIENKINGRIGDFSDGILAVHMQRVRDLIKINAAKIKS